MEAYIYTYVNRETKKTYIGARCAYVGSCYDDFNIKYFSSSKDKEFRKDMTDGKLEGQIVLVMNDENANKKIFEVEAKMIQAYWDKYGKENSYNHSAGGKFNNAGMHKRRSDESRRKMSDAAKGRIFSEEHRKKIGAASKGRHHSEETRAKISAANKGKTFSDETRAKLSTAFKGKHHSKESKAKISAANKGKTAWIKGKHQSDETKAKISASEKGKVVSEETKTKISVANKGRISPMKGKTQSDETKAKMSVSQKLRYKNPSKWLTQDGEIKMMYARNVKHWHPDWKLIEK